VPSSLSCTLQTDLSGLSAAVQPVPSVTPILDVQSIVPPRTVGRAAWEFSPLRYRCEWVFGVLSTLLVSHWINSLHLLDVPWNHSLHLPDSHGTTRSTCYVCTNRAYAALDQMCIDCHLCYGVHHVPLPSSEIIQHNLSIVVRGLWAFPLALQNIMYVTHLNFYFDLCP
jgi:hypothetical protein